MNPLILVPCKGIGLGKSRLAQFLGEHRRAMLCRWLLCRTLSTAKKATNPARIGLIAGDHEAVKIGRRYGVSVTRDPGNGLNDALDAARAKQPVDGMPLIVLPVDLPLIRSADVKGLLASRADVVVAPDRRRDGTNLLALLSARAARSFVFRFGAGSLALHQWEAARLGLKLEFVEAPGLGLDLDTVEDLALWMQVADGEAYRVLGGDNPTARIPEGDNRVIEIERFDRTPRMSRIVRYGDLVFLSGQTAKDAGNDVAVQTVAVLRAIEEKLERAGSDKHHILSATIWLSDIRYFSAMNEVWDAWVSAEHPPARATVEARLADPAILVEIGITAVRN